jgi:hypothetical protein
MLPSPTLLHIAHPEGDLPVAVPVGHGDTFPIHTAGGVFHVRYDPDERVSATGGAVPFAQFLQASRLFVDWVSQAPLSYASNRAHEVQEVLGTLLLSILNGHYRFAHVAALRGDTVTPSLLGMRHMVSEDSVRNALKRMVENGDSSALTMAWLRRYLRTTLEPLLAKPWVLDVDVTVKPVYGRQPGSVVGYNPMKPGRPSHALHSFVMAQTRLVLDVVVHPGNEHTSKSTLPDFQALLVDLPRTLWPALVRGDCGFGTEDMMAWPEAHGIDYLFKQRMTTRTRALVRELDLADGWVDAGQRWQGKSATLKLSTWTRERRVVVLRRPVPRPRYARAAKSERTAPKERQEIIDAILPQLIEDDFEYQVLVTTLTEDIPAIAQCYRDRADAENVFDEIKNHWGWGGFTSRTFEVTKTVARITALIYNWWSIYVRIADPNHHREAITSRPALLHSVVRLTTSGGRRTLTVTSTNGNKGAISAFFVNLGRWLNQFTANAEQWTSQRRWGALLEAIFAGPLGVMRPSTA